MRPTDQQVSAAYDNAPKAIQDSLTDGIAIDFMINLQARYDLHVDVAGSAVERVRDLLLGLSNPTEFLGELVQLGMNDTVARTIVADLNKEVFIPLRERMQNSPEEARKPVQTVSIPQQSLGAQDAIPAPSIEYQAPVSPTLPGSPVPAPMPEAPAQASTLPEVVTPAAVPTYHTTYPTPNPPQQGWHSAAAVHIYVPSHGAPFSQPSQAPIATPVESREVPIQAPAYEPVVQPYIAPQAPAILPEPVSAPIAPPLNTQIPIKKDYVADPYREPV